MFCAPIVLPYIAATQKDWLSGLKSSFVFSFARIIPYVILSLFSAALGQYLIKRFYDTQVGLLLYLSAGIFISFLGIFVLLGKPSFLHFCLPIKKKRPEGMREMALLGLMVGFAPCVPLLGLLTYITFNSQDSLHGTLLGATFGLGTLISPLILCGLLAGGFAQTLSKKPLIYKTFSRLCGAILLYFGIGMIVRTLNVT